MDRTQGKGKAGGEARAEPSGERARQGRFVRYKASGQEANLIKATADTLGKRGYVDRREIVVNIIM